MLHVPAFVLLSGRVGSQTKLMHANKKNSTHVGFDVTIPPIMPLAAPAATEVNGIWSVTDLPIERLIARRNGS
jgi:hypothetical protein